MWCPFQEHIFTHTGAVFENQCGLTELIATEFFYASVPQLGGYMRQ